MISDTNILIDLQMSGLLGDLFALPFEVHTTDLVIEEIHNPTQRTIVQDLINKNSLIVDSLSSEQMEEAKTLLESNLSIIDCSVWYYAKKSKCTLLTGDKKLRKRAEKDGVNVRGILFVIDQLVGNNIIPKPYAAEKLDYLRHINKRLPVEEVERRLREWTEFAN